MLPHDLGSQGICSGRVNAKALKPIARRLHGLPCVSLTADMVKKDTTQMIPTQPYLICSTSLWIVAALQDPWICGFGNSGVVDF